MFCRTSAGTSGLVASPVRGSPGASATIANTAMLIRISVGIAVSRRRRMYLVIASYAGPPGDTGRSAGPGGDAPLSGTSPRNARASPAAGPRRLLPDAPPVRDVPRRGVEGADVVGGIERLDLGVD